MSRRYATYICGGDETPGPRGTDCPDPLHDHPLPSGYVDADVVAQRRIREGWLNRRCKACGFYGWVPSLRTLKPTQLTADSVVASPGGEAG